jgi:hypothetical protein
MSTNPFAAISTGQDPNQQSTAGSPTGNPFTAISQSTQTSQPAAKWYEHDPLPANAPPVDNFGQIKDAAIGAGKTLVKGLGNIGDIVTGGLTHLLPGSDQASAGIGSTGTALSPTNEDQTAGGLVGDAATFELGSGIMDSLAHLPLAERMIQAAKALKVAQEHPVIAVVAGNAIKSGITGGASTLVATGDPKTAAAGAALGSGVGLAGEGISAVRDLYRPLETAESVQPVLQNAIKDTVGKVASDAGVEAPTSTSIRDTVADLADAVKAKSQPVFQQIDTLTDGAFSNAQADAAKYRGSLDALGKDKYEAAIQKQNDLFDTVKSKMNPDALNQAKKDWRQFNSLSDVADAIQKSTSSQRPEIAALSSASQPAETVNSKQLLGKLNALYNDGTLQTAFGPQAHAILDHAGASTAKLQSITDALTAQKSKQRTVNYVAKRAAVGTAELVGGGAILKAAGVLGGKK